MDNKEFSKKFEDRTKKFAISNIMLSSTLPETPEGRIILNQITKSGTSISANYQDANRSRSKADFINRIKICESEASETQYWLEIIEELGWIDSKKIELIKDEAAELLAIFTSISKSLKK
ncbi:MAG: four helix bundle protein [Bacteroidota bacterium]